MSGWVCLQITILFSGFVSISLFLSSSIMSSSCLNVPLTISNSYLSYKYVLELFTSFTTMYLVLIKSSYTKMQYSLLEACVESLQTVIISMIVIPEFGHHKNVFSFHSRFLDCLSNFKFIAATFKKTFCSFHNSLRKLILLCCFTLIPLY